MAIKTKIKTALAEHKFVRKAVFIEDIFFIQAPLRSVMTPWLGCVTPIMSALGSKGRRPQQ